MQHRFTSVACFLASFILLPVAAMAQGVPAGQPTIELNLNAVNQLKQEQQQPAAAPQASPAQAIPAQPKLIWVEGPKGIILTHMEKHKSHHKKHAKHHRKETPLKKTKKEPHKKLPGMKAPAYPAKPALKARPPVPAAPVKPMPKPPAQAKWPAMPEPVMPAPKPAAPSLPAPPAMKPAPAPALPAPMPLPAVKPAPAPVPPLPTVPPPPSAPAKQAIPQPPAPQAAIPTPPMPAAPKAPAEPAPVKAMNDALSGNQAATAGAKKPSLSINFNATDTALPLAAKPELDTIIKSLKTNPDLRVQLTAYASNAGDQPSTSRRIALSRALSVRAYLIDGGVDTMRILVQAEGDKNPGGSPDRVDVFTGPQLQ